MRKVLLFAAVTVFTIFLVGCSVTKDSPAGLSNDNSNQATENTSNLVTKKFTITGFTWETCPLTAKTALSRLDGVKQVNVQRSGATEIIYDPSKVNMDMIKDALDKVNYGVSEAKWPLFN